MTEVRKDRILSPLLSATEMYWDMGQFIGNNDLSLIWADGTRLTDLDFCR